eukprot:5839728-Amphidinium_carterae.1
MLPRQAIFAQKDRFSTGAKPYLGSCHHITNALQSRLNDHQHPNDPLSLRNGEAKRNKVLPQGLQE